MARSDGTFPLTVVAENGVVFQERVEALFLPSTKDTMVILAHHTPMIAQLGEGELVVRNGRNQRVIASVSSGVVHVGDNEATVLLNL